MKYGTCKTVKRVMGEWHYDDEDIKRLSMIMTLYETDFSKEDIDEYMQLNTVRRK